MVRACKLAGAVLRPNSSLAGVAGSSGLASGGSGCGLRVPLSCALATCGASTAASSTAARQAVLRRAAPFGASFVVMLAASDFEVPPPLAGGADSRWRRPRSALPGKPRDSSRQAECGRDAGDIAPQRVGEGDELPSSLDARRDGLRAAAIGVGEALGGFAKKIGLAAGEREQTLLRRRMRFDRAVGADMTERQSALGERPADQQAAMAVERLALGAKQAHAMARHFIHYALEPGRKLCPGRHGLVVGDAVAIKAWIARPAAEGVPERDIRDGL